MIVNRYLLSLPASNRECTRKDLYQFFKFAKRKRCIFTIPMTDYKTRAIEDEHSEQSEELMADLVLFLTSDRVRNMVKEAVKDGRCLRLAKNMNIE